jgi:hypothetical protein
MEDKELLYRTSELVKVIIERLGKLELNVSNISEVTSSIKAIAVEMKAMREDVNKIDDRVCTIEKVPSKRWNGLVDKIIDLAIGAVFGYFILKLGL